MNMKYWKSVVEDQTNKYQKIIILSSNIPLMATKLKKTAEVKNDLKDSDVWTHISNIKQLLYNHSGYDMYSSLHINLL